MRTADLLIKNARVHTMDEKESASVIAVKDSKIVYVGDDESQVRMKDSGRVIDAQGRLVLPGLIDAHSHMLSLAALEGIELNIGMDLETLLEEIRKYVAAHPEKNSYFGQVYLETCVPKELYRKETLDRACPDKPLMLLGSTCHEEWVNSKALEAAGITKDTEDPMPGEQFFDRDPDGTPTGKIVDFMPFEMIVNACKPCDHQELAKGIAKYFGVYNRLGITGVVDAGVLPPADEASVLEALGALRAEGKVTCRVAGSTIYSGMAPLEETLDHLRELRSQYDDDEIRFRTLKLLQDGCYEARTGSCFEPYLDSDFNRPPSFHGDAVKDIFLKAAKAGFDIHIHGLGNRAIYESLEAAGEVRKNGFLESIMTIAHCQSIREEDLQRFKDYRVNANFTPQWFVVKDDIISAIGQERHDDMFKIGFLDRIGVNITMGSDCPSDELGYEPWKALEMAVTRQTYGRPDDRVMPQETERLSLERAVKAFTINGARQLGMEDKTGSITEGKYADFIIVDRNIFDIDIYDVHNARPVMTVFNGKIVYEKGGEDNEGI